MKYYPFNVLFFLSFIVCSLFARSTSQDTLPDDYLQFSLTIFDDRLEGTSKQLEGFSLSMDVPEEFLKREFNIEDLMALVRNQEIRGTLRYPSSSGSIHAGKTTEIKYEIVRHRNGEDIYMKTSLGYFLWEHVNIQNGILSFAINWWYCPPARIVDLEALEMAEQLLADPAHWHQNDDRKCDNDIESKTWSLFCALRYASVEKMGEYNHHNTAIQTVRFVIDDLVPDHGFAHTLMDYNNALSTTHRDILHVLDLAKERMRDEIGKIN